MAGLYLKFQKKQKAVYRQLNQTIKAKDDPSSRKASVWIPYQWLLVPILMAWIWFWNLGTRREKGYSKEWRGQHNVCFKTG